MKALRWHARNDLRVEEIPEAPPPAPLEVRVRVAFAGICGTDLEEYLYGPIFVPTSSPNPLTGRQAPLTLGHEFSGIVESVGEDVSALAPGDAVAADTLIYCGKCYYCMRHRYNLCTGLAALGLMADGGLADMVTAPAYTFFKVPSPVPLDDAALAEPLAVAVHAVCKARMNPTARVLVAGAGTIGLLLVQVAQAFGASHVAVIEPSALRRSLALRFGADQAVHPDDHLEGEGEFDCALEATGRPESQRRVLQALRPAGRLVLVGIPTAETRLDTLNVINDEREIVGSLSHVADEDFAAALGLLAKDRVTVRELVSNRLRLEHGIEAFDLLARGNEEVVKLLIEINPTLQGADENTDTAK